MSSPIDAVLARLESHKLRPSGRDRWRACCPAHKGSNPSTLSVGVGENGAVLLRCWQGCDVHQVVGALGLELHDLFPPKPDAGRGAPPMRRRRLLTAGQALDLLDFEIGLILLCASDMAKGEGLDETTRERLLLSAARVSMLRDEVHA